jgi:hypothetical protein
MDKKAANKKASINKKNLKSSHKYILLWLQTFLIVFFSFKTAVARDEIKPIIMIEYTKESTDQASQLFKILKSYFMDLSIDIFKHQSGSPYKQPIIKIKKKGSNLFCLLIASVNIEKSRIFISFSDETEKNSPAITLNGHETFETKCDLAATVLRGAVISYLETESCTKKSFINREDKKTAISEIKITKDRLVYKKERFIRWWFNYGASFLKGADSVANMIESGFSVGANNFLMFHLSTAAAWNLSRNKSGSRTTIWKFPLHLGVQFSSNLTLPVAAGGTVGVNFTPFRFSRKFFDSPENNTYNMRTGGFLSAFFNIRLNRLLSLQLSAGLEMDTFLNKNRFRLPVANFQPYVLFGMVVSHRYFKQYILKK